MTWWDHETQSIWSQPWGRAIVGPLKGTQLQIIPFSLVPWKTWLEERPHSLALIPEDMGLVRAQTVSDDFVAGVAIDDIARGYPYEIISQQIITHDVLGDIPLLIHVNPHTRSIHIFIRQLSSGTILSFTGDAQQLIDDQTGSTWNPVRGLATRGDLKGQAMRELPYVSSFDWAWLDFYPQSDFYAPGS